MVVVGVVETAALGAKENIVTGPAIVKVSGTPATSAGAAESAGDATGEEGAAEKRVTGSIRVKTGLDGVSEPPTATNAAVTVSGEQSRTRWLAGKRRASNSGAAIQEETERARSERMAERVTRRAMVVLSMAMVNGLVLVGGRVKGCRSGKRREETGSMRNCLEVIWSLAW